MAKLTKIWGSREIKQGANPSRRGPRLNLIGVPTVQVFLNGEYFGATAGVNALTATNIHTASKTQTIAFGQIHVIGVTGIESGTTTGSPLLQEVQATVNLVANSINSGVIVGNSAIAQVHGLSGDGVSSEPRTWQATLGVIFHLAPLGIDSGPTTGQPEVSQIHALIPIGVVSGTNVGMPSVSIGTKALGQVCIDGTFRNVVECQLIIGGEWKTVTDIFLSSGESWKSLGA